MTAHDNTRDFVPTWNGDMERFEDFKTKVKMLELETEDNKQKLLAPKIARALTGKAKQVMKNFPQLNDLRATDGVKKLLEFLEQKRTDSAVISIGSELGQFFNGLKRKRGEDIANYDSRSDELHERLVKKIRKLPDGETTSTILPKPILGWHLLDRAALGPAEQAQVISATRGSYERDAVAAALKQQWPAAMLAAHDKGAPSSYFSASAIHLAEADSFAEEEISGINWQSEADFHKEGTAGDADELFDQIDTYFGAYEEIPDEELASQTFGQDDIFALKEQARSSQRSMKEAHELLRRAHTARKFYKVGGPEDSKLPGPGQRADNGQSSTVFRGFCLRCGKWGHRARDGLCVNKGKGKGKAFKSGKVTFIACICMHEAAEGEWDSVVDELLAVVEDLPEDLAVGWVILDSGATRSVASIDTLSQWQDRVISIFGSDVCVVNPNVGMNFRFGDGARDSAEVQVHVPAALGDRGGSVGFFGLENPKVPPLLGVDAMRALDLTVSHGSQQVFTVDGTGQQIEVDSLTLPSGHLAINLFGHFSSGQAASARNALTTTQEAVTSEMPEVLTNILEQCVTETGATPEE